MSDEKILAVDAEREIREGLGAALSHLGISVRVAPDGASAYRIS